MADSLVELETQIVAMANRHAAFWKSRMRKLEAAVLAEHQDDGEGYCSCCYDVQADHFEAYPCATVKAVFGD